MKNNSFEKDSAVTAVMEIIGPLIPEKKTFRNGLVGKEIQFYSTQVCFCIDRKVFIWFEK